MSCPQAFRTRTNPRPSPRRAPTFSAPFRYLAPLSMAAFLAVPGVSGASEGSQPPAEELLIFVQPEAEGAIAEAWRAEHLPAIRDAAAQLEIPVRRLDVADGVPDEVRITPFLVYQSARGRAFFQGRYADAGKVKHFLRTSRAIPAPSDELTKTDVAVRQVGRSRVYAPIKITDPAGKLPADGAVADFKHRAQAAVRAAFEAFEVRDRAELGPSDRAFYMDFYPYVDPVGEGELFVSVALFSQFNCIEPVYKSSEPFRGPYARLDEVFARAVRALEDEVQRQIGGSPIGDGFDPIPAETPIKSWAELGLELPKMAGSIDPGAAPLPLAEWPRHWKIAAAEHETPRLIFRFPSPLERYSGEVRELTGSLVLPDSGELRGASGFIEAKTASVTMGEASLDKAVHQKMIHIADFPTSRFTVDRFLPETEPLTFGRPARLHAQGAFHLMGRDVPLDVQGDVEPILGSGGEPRLRVRAAFELRLSAPFGIAGPDGPEPARDTLKFFLDFHLEADPPAEP